jgi:hypothetical protein
VPELGYFSLRLSWGAHELILSFPTLVPCASRPAAHLDSFQAAAACFMTRIRPVSCGLALAPTDEPELDAMPTSQTAAWNRSKGGTRSSHDTSCPAAARGTGSRASRLASSPTSAQDAAVRFSSALCLLPQLNLSSILRLQLWPVLMILVALDARPQPRAAAMVAREAARALTALLRPQALLRELPVWHPVQLLLRMPAFVLLPSVVLFPVVRLPRKLNLSLTARLLLLAPPPQLSVPLPWMPPSALL